MKREKRPIQPTDQDQIQKAIDLIYEMMEFNQNIEPTLWASAIQYVLIAGYKQCDYSYKEFRKVIDQAFEHYKSLFDE